MTQPYTIHHTLSFHYDAPVRESVMTLFVTPARTRRQALLELAIETAPPGSILEFDGPFGNRGHCFDRHAPHRDLVVRARSRVEVSAPVPLPATIPARPGRVAPGSLERQLMLLPSTFVRMSPALDGFMARYSIAPRPGNDLLAAIRKLRATLSRAFLYSPGSTTASSPMEHILETGRGVCQDYAHVMAAVLRHWGMPARYVSGYLGPRPDDPNPGQSHAWVEVWLPGQGWCGFDPANNCDCDERHILVATGRDYADVPPVRGTFRGNATSTLTADVQVIPGDAR